MRKLVIFVLSVMVLTMVGCGKDMPTVETSGGMEVSKETEASEVEESMENTSIVEKPQATEVATTKEETSENQSEQVTEEQTSKTEQASKEEPTKEQETKPAKKEEVKEPEQPKQDVTVPTTEEPKKEEPKKEEPKKEEPKPEQPAVEQPKAVAYDPNQVVALATSKTKALGKISIPEDMDRMLANGEITKEEYDMWYPYDGAGYYSVFVETDLNEAATTSGRKLGSVDGIADHIAGMLALETGPYFYIEYAGITTTGGRDYYEFRCYRA